MVVGQYAAEMAEETQRRTPTTHPPLPTPSGVELHVNVNRFGSMEMEIAAVHLLGFDGLPIQEFQPGNSLRVEIEYVAPQPVRAPIFSVTISRDDGFVCYDTSTAAAGLTLSSAHKSGRIALQLERLDLNSGTYYVDIGIYQRNWAYAYDYHWHVYPLVVAAGANEEGVLRPPDRWEVVDWRLRQQE
jgi:lipopolysaccharide transport system ATP-binding protein